MKSNKALGSLARFTLVGVAAGTLFACGGGGGGGAGDAGGGSSNPGGGSVQTPPPEPAKEFPSFAVQFREGDYWEYAWDQENVTGTSSGTSVSNSSGRFRIGLGDAVAFGGRDGFDIDVTGTPVADIRWLAIAFDEDGLYASTNGATWDTLFDAVTGRWAGGGLIASFDPATLTTATDAPVANAYVDQLAIRAGRSLIQNQCETIDGELFCGDESFTIREFEYYDPIVGVLAYEYVNNSADSGGGFGTIFNLSRNVGLVASSLRGDAVDYRLETEPNNEPVSAAVRIESGETIVGHGAREDSFGGVVPVSLAVAEEEPNSTPDLASVLQLPNLVRGRIASTDTGFPIVSNGGSVTRVIEDFYEIQPGDTKSTEDDCSRFGFNAIHGDVPAGRLDMLVYEVTSLGLLLVADDIDLTPLGPRYRTDLGIKPRLQPGRRYLLGIDAVDVPPDTPYELNVSCGSVTGPRNFEPEISDWYRVDLLVAGPLTIESAAAAFVLTDETGQIVLDQTFFETEQGANTFELEINVDAGSYRIGMIADDEDEYSLRATF